MSFAEDIGQYILQEYLNLLKLPVSLNYTPVNTTDSISVYDTGGYGSIRAYGMCPAMMRPTAQVMVRHSSTTSARVISEELFDLLDGVYNETINGTHYLRVECNAPPTYIGAVQVSTAGKAHEFALNLSSTSM